MKIEHAKPNANQLSGELVSLVFTRVMEQAPGGRGGGGALACNMTRRHSFFKNPTTRSRKKFAFQYPVSEFLDHKTIGK